MAQTFVQHGDNEQARVETLRRYAILDTPCEPEFDELVQAAARECGYPTALLTFMDERRCWFKAGTGLPAADREVRELPREETFCNHAFRSSGLFVVRDALADERFRQLAGVARAGGHRAYAGAQLIAPDGHSIGTLCVFDAVPREPNSEQGAALRRLADRAMALLEARRRERLPAPPVLTTPVAPARPSGVQATAAAELALVVDDNELGRSMMSAMLKRLGCEALAVGSAVAALECVAAQAGRVRYVFVDLHLPEVSGLELACALGAERVPPTIIMMSSQFPAEVRAELAGEGVSILLPEPFSLADVECALQQARARGR